MANLRAFLEDSKIEYRVMGNTVIVGDGDFTQYHLVRNFLKSNIYFYTVFQEIAFQGDVTNVFVIDKFILVPYAYLDIEISLNYSITVNISGHSDYVNLVLVNKGIGNKLEYIKKLKNYKFVDRYGKVQEVGLKTAKEIVEYVLGEFGEKPTELEVGVHIKIN